ncbi:MAG: diguanylate cyclase [Cyanobacteria bacterium J06623_4]
MLKRPYNAPSAAAGWLSSATSDSGNVTSGTPQPTAQKSYAAEGSQGLTQRTGQESKVCVSVWSSHDSAYEPDQIADSCSKHPWRDPVAFQAGHFKDNGEIIASHLSGSDLSTDDALIEEVRQLRQLKQYVLQQTQLRKVERQLRRTLSASAIFGTVVVEAAKLFGAKHVSLLRYQPNAQTFQQVTRYCQNEALAWNPPISFSLSEFPGLVQRLWQGQSLRIFSEQLATSFTDSLQASPPLNVQQAAHGQDFLEQSIYALDEECRHWLAQWPGSWLIVPIRNREMGTASGAQTCWGAMALTLPEHGVWTEGAIAAAQSIAVELTLAIAQSQQYQELLTANQELQKLALSDGLTSLANRRRFDEHLADEWQRLARDQQPLSLILCDLDHFKRYNDTFGHPAGDRCLIRVARALLNGPQRPADLVARYGGEEFAIILPNTDTHGAWRIAQKIHESIRALQIAHAPGNEEPFVTVTMGVSTVVPGHEMTAQMLVQASDLALYHAKQHGRNRTYVNGHYNTVKLDSLPDAHRAPADQPDVMPTSEQP